MSLEKIITDVIIAGVIGVAFAGIAYGLLKAFAALKLKMINKGGLDSNLLDELASSGVKYNVDDIVAIIKTLDGKLVWLENGTDSIYF